MSEIKVNSIKGVAASTAALTINNTDGTCTANITNNLSNRNLIINGAMQVAQRGTSSTGSGYTTVDRFSVEHNGADEAPTMAQADVASGTTPYTLGFRKALKITNGNQTGGAGTGDYIQIMQRVEAQNMATSGWNYTSSSSFITLSFYIKSSVAQVFSGSLRTHDGTSYSYKFDTPSLSADTWTKVTKIIPGNSNLTFDNDNGNGLSIYLYPYLGTTYTTANSDTETWVTGTGGNYANDMTTTWYTTNDATFEMTGLQLEVGSVATDFEHRSFAQELALCQRYCFVWKSNQSYSVWGTGYMTHSTGVDFSFTLPQTMRASPSFSSSGSFRLVGYENDTQYAQALSSFSMTRSHTLTPYLRGVISGGVGGAVGELSDNGSNNATAIFSAEL